MSMREKMARAMCKSDELEWDKQREFQSMYLTHADAALETLLEPTETMIADGFSAAYAADDGTQEVADAVVNHAFIAMIRAAKEGK